MLVKNRNIVVKTLLFLFTLSLSAAEPNYDYKAHEIHEIMELMDDSAWALDRMVVNNYKNEKHWKEQLTIILRESDNIVKLQHPDKLFAEEAIKVAEELRNFLKNFDQLKFEARKQSWKNIKKSCLPCHDVYN